MPIRAQLELGDAVLVEGDKLAVDDGVALDPFQCSCDLDVVAADDLTVATIERDLDVYSYSARAACRGHNLAAWFAMKTKSSMSV